MQNLSPHMLCVMTTSNLRNSCPVNVEAASLDFNTSLRCAPTTINAHNLLGWRNYPSGITGTKPLLSIIYCSSLCIQAATEHVSLWRRPIDLAFIAYFFFATAITFVRGLVSIVFKILTSKNNVFLFQFAILEISLLPSVLLWRHSACLGVFNLSVLFLFGRQMESCTWGRAPLLGWTLPFPGQTFPGPDPLRTRYPGPMGALTGLYVESACSSSCSQVAKWCQVLQTIHC